MKKVVLLLFRGVEIYEAAAIRNAAGDKQVLTLTDTDANRDVVLSGRLDGFEILHFATHGILDSEEPTLSGLVLSGVDEDGKPRSRFLRSQDIAGLTLAARLVVLSGCETGLGRLVDGEGLLGLSRAFFYAGVNSGPHYAVNLDLVWRRLFNRLDFLDPS